MSLNAIASPAAREPGPQGGLGPMPHRRESRLDRVCRAQVDPMLGRVVIERQQLLDVIGDLRDRLREFVAV
jgi:hypothetical protein